MTNTKNNANLLDEPVPDIKAPVLTPQPATSYFERLSKYASDKRESVKNTPKINGIDGLIGLSTTVLQYLM